MYLSDHGHLVGDKWVGEGVFTFPSQHGPDILSKLELGHTPSPHKLWFIKIYVFGDRVHVFVSLLFLFFFFFFLCVVGTTDVVCY